MKTNWIIGGIVAIVIVAGSVFSVMNYFKKPEQPTDNYERIKILLAEELSKIKLDSAIVQNIYYIKQQEQKQKQQIANLDSVQVDSVLLQTWKRWKQWKLSGRGYNERINSDFYNAWKNWEIVKE